MASTAELIKTAVERFQAEVPALQNLKLVFGLELKGRGDIQLYRVELPGPQISKDLPATSACWSRSTARSSTSWPRKGTLKSYRKAVETGHIKASGDSNVKKLVAQVVEKQEQRARLEKPLSARVASRAVQPPRRFPHR